MSRASKREEAAAHNARYRQWYPELYAIRSVDASYLEHEETRRRRQIARGQLRHQNGLAFA